MEKRRYGAGNKRTQYMMDSSSLEALVAPFGRDGWVWQVVDSRSLGHRGSGTADTRPEAEAQAVAALVAVVRADIAEMEAELKEMTP